MAKNYSYYQDRLGQYSQYVGVSKNQARQDPVFKDAYRVDRAQAGRTPDKQDRSASGPWARALVDMGLRDEDDYWDVGDTPPR
jgi:hypothetical protein